MFVNVIHFHPSLIKRDAWLGANPYLPYLKHLAFTTIEVTKSYKHISLLRHQINYNRMNLNATDPLVTFYNHNNFLSLNS